MTFTSQGKLKEGVLFSVFFLQASCILEPRKTQIWGHAQMLAAPTLVSFHRYFNTQMLTLAK